MTLFERIGVVVGWMLAPVTAAVSALRRARMFHPEGAVYLAAAEPARDTRWPDVAHRLSGPALIRLSSAWWRGGRELPDALGAALRFRSTEIPSAYAANGDQDLLLATIQHPWTTPFAPLRTQVDDFLMNDYYAVSPFEIDGVGRARLRLVAPRLSADGSSRGERLDHAVAVGLAVFLLEASQRGEPGWRSLVEVHLKRRVEIDQQALRFWPFREGRGLHPRGFVHALRRGAYSASQRARLRYAT